MRCCAQARARRARPPALLAAVLAAALLLGCDLDLPGDPDDDPDGGSGDPWLQVPEDVAGGEPLPDALRDPEQPLPDTWAPPPGAVVVRTYGEAVMTSDGRHLLFQAPAGDGPACLVVVGLAEASVRRPEGLCELRWIAAEPGGARAWLLAAGGDRVLALRLADLVVEQTIATEDTYTVMEFGPEGDTLVLTNLPTDEWSESQYEWNTYDMDMRHVAVLRPATGVVHEQTFPFAVRDVAFSPVDDAVLVAMSWWQETGLPEAQVHFMDPDTGDASHHVVFPNCADEVVVQPGGTVALLSPRQCFVHPIVLAPPPTEEEWPTPEEEWDDWEEWPEGDPASVIDLVERRFVGNLPGFGPVAISPDGSTAVAFSRQETLARQWNVFQRALVGLVVIRLADLYWQVVEYGGDEPDFFFAPSGSTLLLHDRDGGQDRVVSMDAASHDLLVLGGPPARFEQRATTPDGATVYAVYEGALRRIPVGGAAVQDVPLDFTAAQVFIRPQGDWIVVTEPGTTAIHLLAADDAAPVSLIRP